MCSDLVAGTHGRGFWILDDVTPLRQAAEAAPASQTPTCSNRRPAIRIRFGTNDPTPWPPELPAGENPPPGALVDYYLPAAAGEVKLELLNAAGKVIRTYSSTDTVRNPDPATDPVAYNKICQQTPTAPDCSLPLYWPAPQQVLKTSAGMHRFSWDMHYDPIGAGGGGGRGGGGGGGAVPHRTYRRRELAVGGAGHVHRAADGERQEHDANHHREDGSARENHAGSAADLHADDADGGQRAQRGSGVQRCARRCSRR